MVDVDALKKLLNEAKDWEKVETDIPGVFVVKVPQTKTRPAMLMVEVNPVDPNTGLPKKRKGLFISDFEMYLQFREALEEDKLAQLVKVLEDEVNPKVTPSSKKKIKL